MRFRYALQIAFRRRVLADIVRFSFSVFTRRTEKRGAWRNEAGQTPRSLGAIANLMNICREHLEGRYPVEVIDLATKPERTRTDDIVATPTLV